MICDDCTNDMFLVWMTYPRIVVEIEEDSFLVSSEIVEDSWLR